MILCGASSVGKSTLAQLWCHKHPEYNHIREIARDIMNKNSIDRRHLEQSLSSKHKTVFLQLQHDIMDEQNRREADLLSKQLPFISDRGPDPYVYIDMYCTHKEVQEFSSRPSFVHCLERYRSKLLCFVLCPLSSPKDDGVRLVQSVTDQHDYNRRLCQMLQDNGIPFVYVRERDLEKRLMILEDAMKKHKYSIQVLNNASDKSQPRFNIPFHLDPPALTTTCVSHVRIINSHNVHHDDLSAAAHTNPSTSGKSSKPANTVTVIEVQTSFSPYKKGRTNRMLDRYGSRLVSVSFDSKLQSSFIQSILRPGILINGVEHNFLGCSSSGLKDRTCYVFQGTKEQVKIVRNECGDFSKISSRSKYLKRIGMLFSEVTLIDLHINEQTIIDDVTNRNGDIYTDGCGFIGKDLARSIAGLVSTNDSTTCDDYIPSVYQIRYQGCKGVVAISHDQNDKEKLIIRKSMKKFDNGLKPFSKLGLCDFSKPYSYGHLNKQFIMLLSGLGVSNNVFLEKQKQHFEYLENMVTDPEVAIMICCWKNSPGLAAQIAHCSTLDAFNSNTRIKQEIRQLQNRLMVNVEKKQQQVRKIKLRILVPESRNIFGVCDPLGVLEYGQCFVRPTIRGKPSTITGKVIVGKNPCYLLGDVRVLEAVDDCRLNHLVDCIVFPIKGIRPHPSEIAGSDLDGDQYFVSWDKDLIPLRIAEPYTYPSVESMDNVKVNDNSMIDFFSQQLSETGRIDSYYMYWASQTVEGVTSDKCRELGELFSRSVDASKTGDIVKIPRNLVPEKEVFRSWQENKGHRKDYPHVWEILEYEVVQEDMKFREKLIDRLANESDDDDDGIAAVSEGFIRDLVDYRAAGITEYQIFHIIRKWCLSHFTREEEATEKMIELSEGLNFGKFTTNEQLLAIDSGIPTELITNALNWSAILTPHMKSHFNLIDSHCYWNLYFHAHSSEFQWRHLLRGLLNHRESMIVLQLANEIVFIIHFLCQLQIGQQELQPGSVITYFFSPHFDLHLHRVPGSGYCVNLNDELLQLYQGNIRNTFIWIKSESPSKEVKTELEYDRVSVDLTRFRRDAIGGLGHPRVNKESYTAIECFVKDSNEEIGYFDIYEAYQPDTLTPEVIEHSTKIEELPTPPQCPTVGYDIAQRLKPYHTDTALECLKDSASVCDCKAFLHILQLAITSDQEVSPVIFNCLIDLLTNMAAYYPPFPVPKDIMDCLQVILVTLYHSINKPSDALLIINRLCRLNCHQLISETLIQSITAASFEDYCSCMEDWSLWAFIPTTMAHHYADTIRGLYERPFSHRPSVQELVDLTGNTVSSHIEIGTSEKEQYVCKFLQLNLKHFINELDSTGSKDKINQSSITMMKAYEHKGPSDDGDKVMIGFRSTHGIAPNMFKQGGYVIISSTMTTPTDDGHIDYVPVAVGQMVEFSRHPTNMVVEIIGPAPACLKRSAKMDKGHWRLQSMGNVTAFKRICDALLQILEIKDNGVISAVIHSNAYCDHGNQDVVTGGKPVILDVHKSDENIDLSYFNDNQQRAIKASLNSRLTLIHGPPGTGKTHVACEVVRLRCKKRTSSDPPVLVSAETNMAVDNLARKLHVLGLRVVRIGEGHVSNDVRPLSLEHQVETKRIELGKKKSVHSSFPDRALTQKILRSAEVIATTCTGAGDGVLKGLKFNFVIIDEATQSTEPTTLIPITRDCHQLTLIGDPQQLAPSLATSDDSLKTTLFHRLYNILPSCFLDKQYRMHPLLMDFPSNTFYNGRLVSAVKESDRSLPTDIAMKLPTLVKDPVLFINTSTKEKRIGTSYSNQTEVTVIKQLVDVLLNSNVSASSMVIITPYIGQVHVLKDSIPSYVEVSTIDSFQGRERDIVIFSSVRCNSNYRLGFMDDVFRVNVLLTRAKCALIGVGCKDTLINGSDIWKQWFTNVNTIDKDALACGDHRHASASMKKTRKDYKSTSLSTAEKSHQQKKRGNQKDKGEVVVRKIKSRPRY